MSHRTDHVDSPIAAAAAVTSGMPDVYTVAGLLKQAGSTFECDLKGSSMGDAIPDGTRIRLRFEQEPRLAIGDVVAFGAANNVIVHRIVGFGRFGPARSYLVTRGDGTMLIDHPVPRTSVLAIVHELKHNEQWQAIPAYSITGWRHGLRQAWLWSVLIALHVEHRLARALTITTFTARALFQQRRAISRQK